MPRVHCKDNLFSIHAEIERNFVNGRLFFAVFELFVHKNIDFGCQSLCPTRDFHHAVITQKAFDLAAYHRHGVGGKAHVVCGIEVLYGFKKSDCAKLHQIIVFAPALKTFHHRFDKRNIFFDKLLFCAVVAVLRPFDERERRFVV